MPVGAWRWSRMSWISRIQRSRISGVPCDALTRMILTPASRSEIRRSSVSQAGPRVATILVRRICAAVIRNYFLVNSTLQPSGSGYGGHLVTIPLCGHTVDTGFPHRPGGQCIEPASLAVLGPILWPHRVHMGIQPQETANSAPHICGLDNLSTCGRGGKSGHRRPSPCQERRSEPKPFSTLRQFANFGLHNSFTRRAVWRTRGVTRNWSPKPKAQSPKPKAQSPKPKAQEPKAQSPKPKAQSPKPCLLLECYRAGQFPLGFGLWALGCLLNRFPSTARNLRSTRGN